MTSVSKKRKRYSHPLFDDRGFPDRQEDWESMLPSVKAGRLIRKRKHPAPSLSDIDPNFGVEYDESKHGDIIKADLLPKITHLTPEQQKIIVDVVKSKWRVFSKEGVVVPIKNYECEIDTGNAQPIACKKAVFGPREAPIIEAAIAKLVELDHVYQIQDGEWLAKPLLAPKPHQENVTDIKDFVWRFCVNYIPLNSVTRIVAMPIPRCDEAVGNTFGGSKWRWLMDAVSGYNQVRVARSSQHKLAFAGPNCSKYTYKVMPFGPVNGPVVFIVLIFDVDDTWKDVARSRCIIIDAKTNTKIIVDDVLGWARTFEIAIEFWKAQLDVCMAENLSMSLKKSHIFPRRMEFVGIDVTDEGNRPAMSKHELIKHWPPFKVARDISSFIGFMLFYSKFIPHFEQRAAPLRALAKQDLDTPIDKLSVSEEASRLDLMKALLDDPCIARYDYRKRCYLLTDFSGKGFGYTICQPADDDASMAAMEREIAGGECEFLRPKSKLVLQTTGFGSRRSRGRENKLHSHLGEGFALDWAINKNRAKLWGVRFTAITDCYALRFILTYDGPNPALLRLQMRYMLWAMDLYHRNADFLVQPDYWSRVGADLCFDELTRAYMKFAGELRREHPPVEGTMLPENMPGYRQPVIRTPLPDRPNEPVTPVNLSRLSTTSDDLSISRILTSMYLENSGGHALCLQTIPITVGHISSNVAQKPCKPMYHHRTTVLAAEATLYTFAIYGFNSGHFISRNSSQPVSFDVALAADTRQCGRAMFKQFTRSPLIANSASDLLRAVTASKATSTVNTYVIHTHRFLFGTTEKNFWSTQAAIVRALRSNRGLTVLVIYVQKECDSSLVNGFRRANSRVGWIFSSTDVYYPDYGDSVADSGTVLLGVHRGATANHLPLMLPTPPRTHVPPLESFLHKPFHDRTYAVCLSRHHKDFNESGFAISDSTPAASNTHLYRPRRLYNLHRPSDNTSVEAGSGVYGTSGLCPPFASPNTNIFGSTFGIEFTVKEDTFVRGVSAYEYTSTYNLDNDLTYTLSHPANFSLLDCGIPARTSSSIFKTVFTRLDSIRTENFELHDPSLSHAPAAVAMVPLFTSGAVGSRIPDETIWRKALKDDPQTNFLLRLVDNPGLADNKSDIDKLHYIYRHPARNSHFTSDNGILYLREMFRDDTKYVQLRVVPLSMQHIIFVAFHANPIGGHLNTFRTFTRIRQRYFWPSMYKYIERLISACPGCKLSNITQRRTSDLVYSFPIDAPMHVIFVDIYAAGTQPNFEGTIYYLIAVCGMTSFAVCEATSEQNAETFASAIMKIWLRFGFSHTLVVDKDTKFLGAFKEAAELLKINIHVLSGENHDPMIVERVCRFLNSSLTIFCNERGSNRVALEGILMALYAWNSAPIVGTDISRSLVVVGREFSFPIDFSADRHHILTSNPAKVSSFASEQASLLKACRLVATELVHQHRAYHREFINERRPNPRIYSVGDIVFVKRAVKSIKSRGLVGKLMNAYTGPWRITAKLPGSSYSVEHTITKRIGKRHAAHLSPYPSQLIPFRPIDGPDNRYGQLYTPIQKDPYVHAGIKGFSPSQPFKTSTLTLISDPADVNQFTFPSLSELNAEIEDWHDSDEAAFQADESLRIDVEVFQTAVIAPPTTDHPNPRVPDIGTLVAGILASSDKLFLVSHRVPGSVVAEWALVQVDVQATMKHHPSAMQDGRFLVSFYACHHADKYFNAVNQRYWLEYHPALRHNETRNQHLTHLIRPSDHSSSYAIAEGLLPFRQWLRLTNSDTYIAGPFDFATINNRKTRDRVPIEQWTALLRYSHMFSNTAPSLDLPTYSVHYGQFHTCHASKATASRVSAYLTSPSGPRTV